MLSVLIPCYNEADSIQQTVEQLRRVLDATGVVYEVIVIDDGSKDETAALAEAAGVRVIRHPKNGGYGRALKSGMYNAAYWSLALLRKSLSRDSGFFVKQGRKSLAKKVQERAAAKTALRKASKSISFSPQSDGVGEHRG